MLSAGLFACRICRVSAILTSSANDFARIFCITLPRWIFTVISEMPASAADLFIHKSAGYEGHDFLFAFAQRLEAISEV